MKHLRLSGSLFGLVVLSVSACVPDRVSGPERAATAISVREGVQPRASRGFEDIVLEMDSLTETVGGIYVAADESLVIGVTDESRSAEIRGVGERRFPVGSALRRRSDGGARGVRTVPMRYRFSFLVRLKEEASQALNGVKGLRSFDADERANRVRIGLADESARRAVIGRLTSRGLGTEAFELVLEAASVSAGNLKDKWRPTRGGIQIHFPDWTASQCSIGYNVTAADGQRYLLTASHCTRDFGGLVPRQVNQNNGSAANRVGEVSVNPAWNVTLPACMGYSRCRASDATLIQYDAGIDAPAKIAKTSYAGTTGPGSIDVTGWWDAIVNSIDSVAPGEIVDKMGRTSGWTQGPVLQTCADAVGIDDDYTVLCSTKVGAYGGRGDSGGSVFRFQPPYAPNYRVALGILIAVPTSGPPFYWYSPLTQIISELGPLVF